MGHSGSRVNAQRHVTAETLLGVYSRGGVVQLPVVVGVVGLVLLVQLDGRAVARDGLHGDQGGRAHGVHGHGLRRGAGIPEGDSITC